MPKKTLVLTSLSKKDSHIDVRTVGSLTMTRMSKGNPVKEHNLHSNQILRVSRALNSRQLQRSIQTLIMAITSFIP